MKLITLVSITLFLVMSCQNPDKDTIKKEIFQAEKAFEKMAAEKGIPEAFYYYADENAVIKRKIENDNHLFYIYRLIEKIKFQEIDEIELRGFVQSPYGTEILKQILKESNQKFIPKNLGVIQDRTIRLILNRVSDWEPSSKR